ADFLSPLLMEAALMAAVLDTSAFPGWLERFLPGLDVDGRAPIFAPVRVSDRTDAQIVHLDGLNLSRALCLRRVAAALPEGDGRRELLSTSAQSHFTAGFTGLDGDAFVATHWLASFAALAAAVPDRAPLPAGARHELPRC
ncbi:MAG: DUF2891 family protein, partial [Casimicrobiaceae bacterium]